MLAFEEDSIMKPYVGMVWAALTALLPMAGCSSPGADLPELSSAPDASSYHLGPGDDLNIKVLGADELAGQYLVQDDGSIRMLMIGKVAAAGLTSEQLEKQIADRLKSSGSIVHPQVSASVQVYRPFYILGEVAKPGGYPYATGMRVLSAVAAAQGYTYRANQQYVIITRNGIQNQAGVLSSIQPDDIVRVPERYF
jgi:protein involved in polysaccharide export with SLBB domain